MSESAATLAYLRGLITGMGAGDRRDLAVADRAARQTPKRRRRRRV